MILRSLAFALTALLLQISPGIAQTLTLSPTFGPQTKVVTVSGTGFGASRLVDVYFDDTQVCLTASNSAGAIGCSFEVPYYFYPGTHWVTAAARISGAAATASFLVRTHWQQYHGGTAAHTGANHFESVLNFTTVPLLDQLWRVRLTTSPALEAGNPVIYNGKLYIGTYDGKLHGRDAKTGAKLGGWPKQTGTSGRKYSMNSPVVAGGRVYIGGMDGKLYAFEVSGGAAPGGFPFTLTTSFVSDGTPPTSAGGKILLGINDTMYAIDVSAAPSLAWNFLSASDGFLSAPTVLNDAVYFGSSANGGLLGLSLSTGTPMPGFPILGGSTVNSTPAAANGRLHFQNFNLDRLEVVRPDGAGVPGFPVVNGAGEASPVVARGLIFTGDTSNSAVYAYRSSDGGVVWSKFLDGAIQGLTWANDIIYVSTSRSLWAFAAVNGNFLSRQTVSSLSLSYPVVNDGIVYLMSTDGYLYAYAPNGAEAVRAPARGQRGAPRDEPPALSSLVPDPQIAMTPAIAD